MSAEKARNAIQHLVRPYSSTGANKLKCQVDDELYRLEEEDQSAVMIKEGLKSARNSNT
jgi:hypothetical protein